MAFTADFRMPGGYHFEGPNSSGQTLSAGLFRPPAPSPSTSTYNLAKSTGSLYSDMSMTNTPISNAKRKRTRGPEEGLGQRGWRENMDAGFANDDEKSVQTRYTLAGQIETPGGATHTGNGYMEDSVYSDIDYRRALGPKRPLDEPVTPQLDGGDGLADSSLVLSPKAAGWINTIGDVVGKVWEFCKGGAFRGFYAGGGEGYAFQAGEGQPLDNFQPQREDSPSFGQNIPGGYPQSDYMPYIPDYHEMSTPESADRPAAKRRQTGEKDDLGRNWVMVDEPQDSTPVSRRHSSFAPKTNPTRQGAYARSRHSGYASSTASSNNRRISVPVSRLGSGTPTFNHRSSLRISHAGSPRLSAREPASFAPARSPVRSQSPNPFAVSSPSSRIPVPVQPAGNPFAFAAAAAAAASSASSRPSSRQQFRRVPSPAPQGHSHRRNLSTASSAGGGGGASTARGHHNRGKLDADDIQASPRLDAEAKRLAQKKLAAEREADARVDVLNNRMAEMIRQCQEALGTKVEVYDEGGGGGWEDED